MLYIFFFFFSSRRRHTRSTRDWSSDVCSSDLIITTRYLGPAAHPPCAAPCPQKMMKESKIAPSLTRCRKLWRWRSEERRVGKECRSRWGAGAEKRKEGYEK